MRPPKAIIEVAQLDGTQYPIAINEDLEINPTDLRKTSAEKNNLMSTGWQV